MKYKLLIIFSLLILILTTMSLVSASENKTSEIEIADENIELTYPNIETSDNEVVDKNEPKSQINSDNSLSSSYDETLEYGIINMVKDCTFKIDPTKTNYGTIRIDCDCIEKMYISKNSNDIREYKPLRHISSSNGRQTVYYTASIELPKKAGDYIYIIETHYMRTTYTDKFKVKIVYDSFINATNEKTDVGKIATVHFSLDPNKKSITKNITVTINEKNYTLDKSTKTLQLSFDKPGRYYGYVKANLYNYPTTSKKFYVDVYADPVIVAQTYYIATLGKSYEFNIYAVDIDGNPINDGKMYLNNTKSTVNKGYAHFIIYPKEVGIEYYTIRYVPNSESHYKPITFNNKIIIATTTSSYLKINNLNTIAGTRLDNIKYSVTDNLGNDISGYGYYLVNGRKYNSLYDVSAPKKAGTTKYTVKFISKYDFFGDSSARFKIVTKLKTNIHIKSIKGYENKKVKITAVVKDNLGKKVKKGTVTFKIRGKTYNVKVKNGKAVKTIKIPKTSNRGITYYYHYKNNKEYQKAVYDSVTFKCSASYKENSQYLKCSKKFNVVSKKKSVTKRYYTPYNTPSESTSSYSEKTTPPKKTTTKKTTTTKSYGYYPTSNKPIPCLDTNLFKKKPAFDTSISLKNIIITV